MFGVKDVVISSVFLKQQFKLTIVIRQVNDLLKDKSKENNLQLQCYHGVVRDKSIENDLQ